MRPGNDKLDSVHSSTGSSKKGSVKVNNKQYTIYNRNLIFFLTCFDSLPVSTRMSVQISRLRIISDVNYHMYGRWSVCGLLKMFCPFPAHNNINGGHESSHHPPKCYWLKCKHLEWSSISSNRGYCWFLELHKIVTYLEGVFNHVKYKQRGLWDSIISHKLELQA